jgi:hypothetical protein
MLWFANNGKNWQPWMKKWKDKTSTLKVNLWPRDNLLQLVFLHWVLRRDLSSGSTGSHPRQDLRNGIRKTRPRPTHRNRRLLNRKCFFFWEWSLGVRFSNYFSKFWLRRFPAVLPLIDAFTYCDMFDTNVMELVLDYRHTRQTDSLEDPSSTAIPFATHAQAVAGEWGTN